MPYTTENWSIDSIVKGALKLHKNELYLPRIQRRKAWRETPTKLEIDDLRDTLIDSVKKQYPIGSLVVNKMSETEFAFIDGHQRISSFISFYKNFFDFKIVRRLIEELKKKFVKHYKEDRAVEDVTELHNRWFSKKTLESYEFVIKKKYKNIQEKADKLIDRHMTFEKDEDRIDVRNYLIEQTNKLADFINILNEEIPIIVLKNATEIEIAEIFNRLNRCSVPLRSIEIYTALWIKSQKLKVKNTYIVDEITKYYKQLKQENDLGLMIYDEDKIGVDNNYNPYDYMIGLHGYLMTKTKILSDLYLEEEELIFDIIKLLIETTKEDDKKTKASDKYHDIPSYLYKLSKEDNLGKFEQLLVDAFKFADGVLKFTVENDSSLSKNKKNKYVSKPERRYVIEMIVTYLKYYKKMTEVKDVSDKIVYKLKKHIIPQFQLRIIYNIITNFRQGEGKKQLAIIDNKIYLEPMDIQIIKKQMEIRIKIAESGKKKKLTDVDKLLLALIRHSKYKPDKPVTNHFAPIIPKKKFDEYNKKHKDALNENNFLNFCYYHNYDTAKKPSDPVVKYLLDNDKNKKKNVYDYFIYVSRTNYEELIEDLTIDKETIQKFYIDRLNGMMNVIQNEFSECLMADSKSKSDKDSESESDKESESESEKDSESESEKDSESESEKDSESESDRDSERESESESDKESKHKSKKIKIINKKSDKKHDNKKTTKNP